MSGSRHTPTTLSESEVLAMLVTVVLASDTIECRQGQPSSNETDNLRTVRAECLEELASMFARVDFAPGFSRSIATMARMVAAEACKTYGIDKPETGG